MNLKSSHSHLCGLIVFVSLLLPACQQKPDEQAYWTKVEAYANAYQLLVSTPSIFKSGT